MDQPLSRVEELQHLAYHVFLPPDQVLPQAQLEDDADRQVNMKLVDSVVSALEEYKTHDSANAGQWQTLIPMLEQLRRAIGAPLQKARLSQDICSLRTDDSLALFIRAQNAAVIVRKKSSFTRFEVLEVQLPTDDVMSITGKIVRQYPGPAVEVPNSLANQKDFVDEISNVLVQMDRHSFKKAAPMTRKGGSEVHEIRDMNNPNYFVQLFLGILRGMGELVDPPRVQKRIGDQVLWKSALLPWRRSPIWFIIRVAVQTSLESKRCYKHFMAFYHAYILSQCISHDEFSSDLLYAMRVKMGRRVFKLRDSVPEFIIDTVKSTADAVGEILQARWDKAQETQSQPPGWGPLSIDFEAAKHHTLPHSGPYLEKVFRGRLDDRVPSEFEPSHKPRLDDISDFTRYANNRLAQAFKDDGNIALFDFEHSVYNHLDTWTTSNLLATGSACRTLYSCVDQYLEATMSSYAVDIADKSVMLLTVLKLWVAIDRLVTHAFPLLCDFSPELPCDMVEPLLLRTSEHLLQARQIEEYLCGRHNRASPSNNSIFSDIVSPHSFAVQYFQQSSQLQALKSRIIQDAQNKRDEKIRELDRKNAEYSKLEGQAFGRSHEYDRYYNRSWRESHRRSCELCRLKKDMDSLKVALHEWPLPTDEIEAQMVAFELRCPAEYSIWRDMTYLILRDLGEQTAPDPIEPWVKLESYDDLRPWMTIPDGISPRVILASRTKTFTQSHYSKKSIPAEEDSVCVNNALQYQLYDKSKLCWVTGDFAKSTFAHFGTFPLPAGSAYSHLQYALESTTHTSNQILADQFDCPKELSLHEHISFGTLRSGARLQWMNIVRGLEENILTFGSWEVNLLHTQAAWQIGLLTDGSREWHAELANLEYAELLVHQCQRLLNRVESNWLEAISVYTVVLLVTRLLASSSEAFDCAAAFTFLRSARIIAANWISKLQGNLKGIEDEATVIDYQHRICEMAAICRSTFDVGPNHMSGVLSTPADLLSLVECSIALYDNTPPDLKHAPKRLQILVSRDQRLAHKILPFTLKKLREDQKILCRFLAKLWPAYSAGPGGWTEATEPNARWISTRTLEVPGRRSQTVHLNLVEGRLLIDGKPLGRLPRSFIQHPTYIRVFGQAILDVIPSSSPGMEFSTRDSVHHYEVSFAFDDDTKELVIQARKDCLTFELVPFAHLNKDFPEFFLTDYHHWALLTDRTVEFRRLSDPWCSSKREWVLDYSAPGRATMRDSGNDFDLVDTNSALFLSLALRFSPLESAEFLHVTISQSREPQTIVDLPRMKVSFFVNKKKQLQSSNFPGFIVDEDQSAGTLIGLKNQLILRAQDPIVRSLPRSRTILIPHGDIHFRPQGHHVSVSICPGSDRHVLLHQYIVDVDMGCLSSDAGLTSRLYKTYLHSLTSNCLPDPLLGRTGTEEALCALFESATSSFDQIDEEQGKLLKLIGSVTPTREYYPEHLMCMQSTEWSKLPPLSQHFGFAKATELILQRADLMQLFHPLDFDPKALIVSPRSVLLCRAAIRTYFYYPPETESLLSKVIVGSGSGDKAQLGRDDIGSGWIEKGQICARAARLAFESWGRPFYQDFDLVAVAKSWDSLDASPSSLTLTYSAQWLNLDLSSCWIKLYNLCRYSSRDSNQFRLSSCLATAAFSQKLPPNLLPVLIAFAANPEFSSSRLSPPNHSVFLLGNDGFQPTLHRVQQCVSSNERLRAETPAENLSSRTNESYYELEARKDENYYQKISSYKDQIAEELLNQWPSTNLRLSPSPYGSWFAVEQCKSEVQEYFLSCSRNVELRSHLEQVRQVLTSRSQASSIHPIRPAPKSSTLPTVASILQDHGQPTSLDNLLGCRRAPEPADLEIRVDIMRPMRLGPPTDTGRLTNLFSEFGRSAEPLNRQYGHELDKSRRDLETKPTLTAPNLPELSQLIKKCELACSLLNARLRQIELTLGPSTPMEEIMNACGLWPRITPRCLLQRLTLKSRHEAPVASCWQRVLINYAKLYLEHQRSQRLITLAKGKQREEFWKELKSADSASWEDEDNMDWLLVQIDGGFSARTIQRQVAKEMMYPSSELSTVLQLNMGEGKSSVIVPMIAASLADTKQLVRVVVLKPLWRQMFHLLVNRLSGLVNRRIYYLPFGRHIRVDSSKAQQLQDLYAECMREGGILLTQPEHILSFKLMEIDQLVSPNSKGSHAAKQLRSTQDWLTSHARDILDESDEILHVRYQLVYTVGEQQPLEDYPDRWTTTQQLLHLTARRIYQLDQDSAEGFQYEARPDGRFPKVRIMPNCTNEIEEKLINIIAEDVLTGMVQNLNCTRLSIPNCKLAQRLLSTKNLPYHEYELLKQSCDSTLWRGLLLVRGLLASGIVTFALKERHYRVDYGLDLNRSLLAVPFRAKDIPSARAEFGHPDVAVVLTCLSYYYKGLTSEQLDNCFELLYKLDNPALEYDLWVKQNYETPESLRQLSGVNIKDREQYEKSIMPHFSCNSAVIDFFLSSVVFPKSAKEFPHKLSTSGWDLAEHRPHVTTGFSGTNDNRYLLPTSITQADPVKQLSTNALVLTYLLQPENNSYLCMRDERGHLLKTKAFLELLVRQKPEVRVLLDVGAQMLELQNEALVRCWLGLTYPSKVEAAVYFNDRDELVILPRNGGPCLFFSSPYARQLDKCIIYLDDGHTRGTDLKLPQDFRALVTLGPKVTKDRLLQGCMRMRKLGHGQSVMFAAPPEIDNQIRLAAPDASGPKSEVDTLDVLRWAMLETCKDLKRHVSHWAQQGIEYSQRNQAQQIYNQTQDDSYLKKGWMLPEARSLEEMYGIPSPSALSSSRDFTERAFDIPSLRERLDLLGIKQLENPGMDEEQEREVSHEIEREEQVQRPPKGIPAAHQIHRGVRKFVETGLVLKYGPTGFTSLFQPFKSTTSLYGWSTKLLASEDFSRTLTGLPANELNEYMRPINWVVRGSNGILAILSPYEVNELLPFIRESPHVSLHIYAPRVIQTMRAFSNLDFFSLPSHSRPEITPWLPITQLQLDLFAGQLYLSSYQDYIRLCALLGLYPFPGGIAGREDIAINTDGFVEPTHREELIEFHPEYAVCKFITSPIPVLKDLIGGRRKGMKYMRTHVGQILHARILTEEEFC